jgi:hypothetical protein
MALPELHTAVFGIGRENLENNQQTSLAAGVILNLILRMFAGHEKCSMAGNRATPKPGQKARAWRIAKLHSGNLEAKETPLQPLPQNGCGTSYEYFAVGALGGEHSAMTVSHRGANNQA